MQSPTSAAARFLQALRELLKASQALAADPTQSEAVQAHAWGLKLAKRSLSEAGGLGGLSPEEQHQAHVLARSIKHVDRPTLEDVQKRLLRLRQAHPNVQGGCSWEA